jgi:hypothetical protein
LCIGPQRIAQGVKWFNLSKLWHEFLGAAEGFNIVALGLTLLVVMVAVAALILHFAS